MSFTGAALGGDREFDQVLYGWSNHPLLGPPGVGPVATSFDADRLADWDPVLSTEVWADEGVGMCYLVHQDQAAVVCKLTALDKGGRRSTFAHALVGPAAMLAPEIAIGLTHWRGWRTGPTPEETRLATVPGEMLTADAARGLDLLRDALLSDPATLGYLRELAAGVIDDPGGKFTVLREGLPVPELVCGLLDLLGSCRTPWTFATCEKAGTRKGLPRIAFTSTGKSTSDRRKLVLRAGAAGHAGLHRPSEVSRELAAALVDEYRADGVAIRKVWPASSIEDAGHVQLWVKELRSQYPLKLLRRIAAGHRPEPREEEELRAQASIVSLRAGLRGCDDHELRGLLSMFRPNTTAGRRLPEVADLVRIEAVGRVFEDTRPLDNHLLTDVEACVSAAERRRLVREALGRLPADQRVFAAGAGAPPIHSALAKAAALGVGAKEPAVNALLHRVPTSQLLAGAALASATAPDLGSLAIQIALERHDDAAERELTKRVLEEHAFLLDCLTPLGYRPHQHAAVLARLLFIGYADLVETGEAGVRALVERFDHVARRRGAYGNEALVLLLRALCEVLAPSPALHEAHAQVAVRVFAMFPDVPAYTPSAARPAVERRTAERTPEATYARVRLPEGAEPTVYSTAFADALSGRDLGYGDDPTDFAALNRGGRPSDPGLPPEFFGDERAPGEPPPNAGGPPPQAQSAPAQSPPAQSQSEQAPRRRLSLPRRNRGSRDSAGKPSAGKASDDDDGHHRASIAVLLLACTLIAGALVGMGVLLMHGF